MGSAKIMDDRIADRLICFASVIVEQLAKNARCQRNEVEATRDRGGP